MKLPLILLFQFMILAMSSSSLFAKQVNLTGQNFAPNEFLYRIKKESCAPLYWISEESGKLELAANCPESMNNFSFTANKQEEAWSLTPKQKKIFEQVGIWSGPTIITMYGLTVWGWAANGVNRFRIYDEKWFEKTTYTGGVDKLGHAFTHYVVTRAYYSYFTNLGYSSKEAITRATLETAAIGLYLEVGDALSNYGFSYSDLIVDLMGVALGGVLSYYPRLDELIGFQQQWFNPGKNPESDYEHMRWVLNFKASGVEALREIPVVKYLAFDLGYGATGFSGDIDKVAGYDTTQTNRELFAGLSINFSKLIENINPTNQWAQYGSTFFKYYQPRTNFNRVDLMDKNF